MLTLFLRKDIARARVLADDLDRYSHQLHYTLAVGRLRYGDRLATPKGLLICFGAGAAFSLLAGPRGGAGALVAPLLSLARGPA